VEKPLEMRLRSLLGLVLLASVPLACDSSPPVPKNVNPTAITDRRIKFKEEYKEALGKNGQLIKKPGLMKKYRQSTGASKP
jgi:hypothetical protein